MHTRILFVVLFLVLTTLSRPVDALDPEPDAVFMRVVDTGAGLCCVILLPGNHAIIYDAGQFQNPGEAAADLAIRQLLPVGRDLDLLVLSHSDADHLGNVPQICENYRVRRVIRDRMERTTDTWKAARDAVEAERDTHGCIDTRLGAVNFPHGGTFRFGDAFVTMVAGWGEPPDEWGLTDTAERFNSVSVVIRIAYKGKSILLTGDTVGRHRDDPAEVCIAAERAMVDAAQAIRIDADVLVAPHHGADNGSSTDFIRAVNPRFVIFSAGHDHEHPRAVTAGRYLAAGIPTTRMFRTDLGDDEGGAEWAFGRLSGNVDRPGDDDVDVLIRADGTLLVEYRLLH